MKRKSKMMWVNESDEGYENYISFKQLLTKRLYKEKRGRKAKWKSQPKG